MSNRTMIVACPACDLRYDVTGHPPGTRARCRCGQSFYLPEPPSNAKSLGCPQCGAACAPDRVKCEYCDAVLATVRCPRCFGLAFRGAAHCGHCGTVIERAAEALGSSGRPCPRCAGQHLTVVPVGQRLIDQCDNCQGTWLDKETLAALVAMYKEQGSLHAAVGAGPRTRELPVPELRVQYIPCPDCKKQMMRRNYGRTSGVIIDECGPHGTWFDRNELPKVVEFIAKGGTHDPKAYVPSAEEKRLAHDTLRSVFEGPQESRRTSFWSRLGKALNKRGH